MLVSDATLADVRAVEKITAIKLQARFGRQNFHESSRGRLVNRSDQLQVFSLAIEHPVMIVALSKLQLFVVVLDPSTDRSRFVEIERGASNGLQLPGRNQTFIDGRELTGLDHQLVP